MSRSAKTPAPKRAAPKRRAGRAPTEPRRPRRSLSVTRPSKPGRVRRPGRTLVAVLATVLVAATVAALVWHAVDGAPDWLSRTAAVVVAVLVSTALAARTGGRPWVFGLLALVCATTAVVTRLDFLVGGTAVGIVVVSAILAVVVTVPAVSVLDAIREVVVACAVVTVAALAVLALEPRLDLGRFEYACLGLAMLGGFVVIYRLGAGFHGLGSRGLVTVIVGTLLLAGTMAYAELLRRYGTPGLVHSVEDLTGWLSDHLGASPRPIILLLGIPALTWGTHMRARRRQGWWVCLFGVAATAPIGQSLLDPAHTWNQVVLAVGYAVTGGLVIGVVLILLDVALTTPRGAGRRATQREQLRPEPRRTEPLL